MFSKAKNLAIETRAFIDGGFVDANHGDRIVKLTSVDGSEIPSLTSCQQEEVDAAVQAATRSYKSGIWKNLDVAARQKALANLADSMEAHREELALLDTLETGRAYANYYYDSLPKAISALRYFVEAVDKYYDYAVSNRFNVLASITTEPLGPVALITPWNDPMVVTVWKLAPALLMGNSVVLKPAEQSSYSALKLASLSKQAGIPAGVLNVVPGYGEVAGKALALHHDIRGIFFTGSSATGKKILTYSGQSNMKKVGLECGGKSAFILSKQCNQIENAVKTLAQSIFYNQGQICSAPSRAFVHTDLVDEFMRLMSVELNQFVPADPFDITTRVGCVVNQSQMHKIERYIALGKQHALSFIEPTTPSLPVPGRSCVNPIVFHFADQTSTVASEEIFGPVLSVFTFDDIDVAVKEANNSGYGLAAAVWTADLDEALYVSRNLEAGIVHVNSYGDDDNSIPFGGIKESGIGKDKSLFAFHEYCYQKSTWISFRNPT